MWGWGKLNEGNNKKEKDRWGVLELSIPTSWLLTFPMSLDVLKYFKCHYWRSPIFLPHLILSSSIILVSYLYSNPSTISLVDPHLIFLFGPFKYLKPKFKYPVSTQFYTGNMHIYDSFNSYSGLISNWGWFFW